MVFLCPNNVVDAAIKSVSDAAIQEALQIAPDGGQFEYNGKKYQLQLTKTYDLADYCRYKGAEACSWRELAQQKAELQAKMKATTKIMDGLAKSYALNNEDKEPDEIKTVVKCIKDPTDELAAADEIQAITDKIQAIADRIHEFCCC